MAQNLDLGKVVGSQILNVTSAPASSVGLDGDWALNATSGDVYMRAGGTWAKKGNFKGAAGSAGAAGAKGADGVTPALSIDANGHLIATYT